MTVQTKYFIQPTDLKAIRYECKNPECQTVIIIPLPRSATEIPRACPTCRIPWTKFDESTYEGHVKEFAKSLEMLKHFQDKFGCLLSLEITELHSETISS
jgi:hypothetical protein